MSSITLYMHVHQYINYTIYACASNMSSITLYMHVSFTLYMHVINYTIYACASNMSSITLYTDVLLICHQLHYICMCF